MLKAHGSRSGEYSDLTSRHFLVALCTGGWMSYLFAGCHTGGLGTYVCRVNIQVICLKKCQWVYWETNLLVLKARLELRTPRFSATWLDYEQSSMFHRDSKASEPYQCAWICLTSGDADAQRKPKNNLLPSVGLLVFYYLVILPQSWNNPLFENAYTPNPDDTNPVYSLFLKLRFSVLLVFTTDTMRRYPN